MGRLSKMAALPRTYSKFLRSFSPPAWLACPEKDTEEGGSSGRRHFSSEPSPRGLGQRQRIFPWRGRGGEARVRGLRPPPHQVQEIPLGRWKQIAISQRPYERSPRRLRGALNCPSSPDVMTLSPV